MYKRKNAPLLPAILKSPTFLFSLGALILLYFSYFAWPFTPLWLGIDQFAFIQDAARLWAGETFYRDFFEIIPPGTHLVDLIFFPLFGLRNWIPNLVTVIVGFLTTLIIIYICRKLIRASPSRSLLPAFLLLSYLYRGEIHRWWSSLAVFSALAVLIERRSYRRLAAAGALCGIASFFTQTQGVFALAGLTVFMTWESHKFGPDYKRLIRGVVCVYLTFTATLLATYAYFVWKAGFQSVLFGLVTYPSVFHPLDRENFGLHMYLSGAPSFLSIADLRHYIFFIVIHLLVPFIYSSSK